MELLDSCPQVVDSLVDTGDVKQLAVLKNIIMGWMIRIELWFLILTTI